MAALLSLNIAVQASPQITTVIDAHAKNLTWITSPMTQGQGYQLVGTAEQVYQLLANLVQAAGPNLNNNQGGINTLNSYKPVGSNNNHNNLFARNQPMNESQLLLAAADALAVAIAKAMIAAIPQDPRQSLLPLNYQLPNLPLKYLFPLDKREQVIYLCGRAAVLPPMLLLILEKLLVAPANTIVSIRNEFAAVNEGSWNVHMCKLRNLVRELTFTTVKMQGYRVSVRADLMLMSIQQRCKTIENEQARQPVEAEVF